MANRLPTGATINCIHNVTGRPKTRTYSQSANLSQAVQNSVLIHNHVLTMAAGRHLEFCLNSHWSPKVLPISWYLSSHHLVKKPVSQAAAELLRFEVLRATAIMDFVESHILCQKYFWLSEFPNLVKYFKSRPSCNKWKIFNMAVLTLNFDLYKPFWLWTPNHHENRTYT